MLDRKTKDIDASMELLEDRKKNSKLFFLIFYIVGGFLAIGSVLVTSVYAAVVMVGIGVAVLVIASYMLMIHLQYGVFVFLKTYNDKEKKHG